MPPENYSKNLLSTNLLKELKKMNLSYNEERLVNDISTYNINEYIYISSFKRKHNLSYDDTIKICRLCIKMNILREVFVVSYKGKWIEKYYKLSEIPNIVYDEEDGIDISVKEENIFTCFEVISNVK
nr:MAG TPA: hypothetical protein [Caudoviricetes sp.]